MHLEFKSIAYINLFSNKSDNKSFIIMIFYI